MKSGTATLPLHWGKAPKWLFSRMVKLAREITIAIIEEYGAQEMLNRLADPYWFQSFGCVLGFDWHSSGVTTTTCGAVKEGIRGIEKELGFFTAGGKGGKSRKTPQEIEDWAVFESVSIDPEKLIYASKMAAKVDNTAIQDGYQLYHHNFFFTDQDRWAVVQQGLPYKISNKPYKKDFAPSKDFARRYHWLSDKIENSFVEEPKTAICDNQKKNNVLNLTSKESQSARNTVTELSNYAPWKLSREIKHMKELKLFPRHEILVSDLNPKSIEKIMLKAYEKKPQNFEQLLGINGIGPKSIRALTLITELTYGTKADWNDPVKYSFTHGGKDGIPYPVDRATYDQSIKVLKRAIEKSKVDRVDKKQMFLRLFS